MEHICDERVAVCGIICQLSGKKKNLLLKASEITLDTEFVVSGFRILKPKKEKLFFADKNSI